jgi:hydrogenase-4 component F
MLEIVFLIPFLTGAAPFFSRQESGGPAGRHRCRSPGPLRDGLGRQPGPEFSGLFCGHPEGLLSLLVISLLFFLISIYTIAYLKASDIHAENIFTGSMLLFLSTMTMVTLSDHIMVMWIAIEATTLASAPLIYTHRSAASLEATWKYVLICSVGIAMALLGSVLVTVAMDVGGWMRPSRFPPDRGGQTAGSHVAQGRFCFHPGGLRHQDGAGPHAHLAARRPQRSPQPGVGPAFRRAAQLCLPGHFQNQQDHACRRPGRFFRPHPDRLRPGIDAGGGHLYPQADRIQALLAYSSIENMGIIAFGTGIGGLGAYGAMICLIHHSLIKSSLFLTSGNILLGFGSRLIAQHRQPGRSHAQNLRGLFRRFCRHFRVSAVWHFIGELLIIIGAFRTGNYVGGLFHPQPVRDLRRICQQYHENFFRRLGYHRRIEENATMVWPQYALLLTSLVLCFWMPDTLYQTIIHAVNAIGGGF